MTKKANLLWLDLEMTGTDIENDVILEAAAIATDWNFQEIVAFEAVVYQNEDLMKAQMAKAVNVWSGKSFWDENPAARDNLVAQNKQGQPENDVEQLLIGFITDNFELKGPVYLAGNSIHNDRRFIAKYMPELDKKIHYRMLDVTAWKLIFENKFHQKFALPKSHRAIDDIRRSIKELEYYLKKVKP
jgi:oligoribonuclease